MKFSVYSLYIIALLTLFGCQTTRKEDRVTIDSAVSEPLNNEGFHTTQAFPYEPSDEDIKIYDRLFDLLTVNDFKSAQALVNEKKFNINAFETSPAMMTRCFTTLLYRFAGRDQENVKAVEFLLEQNVNPNNLSTVVCEEGISTDYTHTCNTEIGELLISAGSDYALNGLLECAAANKDLDRVNALLDRGGNPSFALNFACEIHDRYLFQKLLNKGVDKDDAFFWAVAHEDFELAKMMIEKGARLKQINPIAKSNNTKMRDLVIPWCNPQAYTELAGGGGFCDGNELMFMVQQNNYSAVEFILKIGANPNIYCWADPLSGKLDCNTSSPLGIAESNGNTALIELLKKYGAKKPDNCK